MSSNTPSRTSPHTVGEVCSRKFVTVPRRRRVVEVSRIIASRWVSCVIVTEERRPVGIVTKHSLVRDVLARGYTGMELTAGDIMRSPIVSVTTEATLEEAAGLMAATKIRYLAVTEDGSLVGLLSHYHIARLLPTLLRPGVNSDEDQVAATPEPA